MLFSLKIKGIFARVTNPHRMEQLLTDINNEVQYCTAFLFAFMALFCFTLKLPKTELFSTYRTVQNVLGIACSIWAVKVITVVGLSLRTEHLVWATAYNMLCYYTVLVMVVTAMIVLLSPQSSPKNLRFLRIRITSALLFYIVVASTVFLPYLRQSLYITATCWFVIELVVVVRRFATQASTALLSLDNFCSDDAQRAILGIRTSILVAISYIFVGFMASFAPTWIITIFNIVGITGICYTYITIQNYRFYLQLVAKANAEREKMEKKMEKEKHRKSDNRNNTDTKQPQPATDIAPFSKKEEEEELSKKRKASTEKLTKNLNTWIKHKGFAGAGITITDLSRKLGTNRTYLTIYIYNMHHKTFREWIAELRISYAKQLLKEGLSVSEVSHTVGYSTVSHFSKVFTNLTAIQPKDWKAEGEKATNTPE